METEKKIAQFLDTIVKDEQDDNEITVVPLMCGTGKSSYISQKMKEVISSNGRKGLLVVTDSVERMNGYQSPFDDDLKEFMRKNQSQILVITAENSRKTMFERKVKPIVIVSTQRYFRLSREEILDLLSWRNGKRCLVMFDEKPYLTEQVKITIKTFTDIDAILQMSIDDTANQADKAWAVNQWQLLERRIQSIMDEYEGLRDGQFSLYHKDVGTMTTDDERFKRIVNENKAALISMDSNIQTNLCAIEKLTKDGAIFTCRKKQTGEYDRFFSIILDNRDKVTNIGAKVIVLDATGDVTPEYNQDYVRVLSCHQYKRELIDIPIKT